MNKKITLSTLFFFLVLTKKITLSTLFFFLVLTTLTVAVLAISYAETEPANVGTATFTSTVTYRSYL